ncbi:MAG: Rab family GTPase [Promethearchaeota archaeon]
MLGDGKVGKTSLMSRYVGEDFTLEYIPTIGANFLFKQVSLETSDGPKNLRFQIWDLAGQPTFDQIRKLYYKGSIGAFLVFDLTSPDSLENLEWWLQEYSKNTEQNSAIIVLGNKRDLTKEIKVPIDTAKNYIENRLSKKFSNIHDTIDYFETSAKSGENVDQAFSILGYKIITKHYC